MESTGCFVVFLVVIAFALVATYLASEAKRKALAAAWAAYQSSLSKLKGDPANPDLRKATLELGRTYSNLSRDKKGVTIFDEVALSNDIQAACAAAAAPPVAPPVALTSSAGGSLEERLKRLSSLKAQGLISDAEFEEGRRKIIGEI